MSFALRPQRVFECPYCKKSSMIVDEKHGEYVCTICGAVSKVPVYDQTSEYRNFAIEHGVKDKSRTTYSGDNDCSDLGTTIENKGNKRSKQLIQINQRITTDPKVANLKKSIRRIQELAGRLDLSRAIANDAKETYKEAMDKDLLKNYKRAAVDAVCIFDACNKNGEAMRKEDIILQAGDVVKKEFDNVLKALHPILHGPVSAAELAKRYADKLYTKPFICSAILKLGKKVEEWGILTGKQPDSIAGAIIAFINKLLEPSIRRSASDISNICGVSEETISKYLEEIEGFKEQAYRIPEVKGIIDRFNIS